MLKPAEQQHPDAELKRHIEGLSPQIFPEETRALSIRNRLAGGVISHIFAGTIEGRQTPVVIKLTEDRTCEGPPFNTRTDHFIPREGHNLDTQYLRLLKAVLTPDKVIIPSVLGHSAKDFITVMEHLGEAPYNMTLMSEDLNTAIQNHGIKLGMAMAHVQVQIGTYTHTRVSSDKMKPIVATEDALKQFEERGSGLLEVYRNDQKHYRRFLEQHSHSGNPMIPTDFHPKNLFFNRQGNWGIIDYGRTVKGDPKFVLPNFVSHILMNYIIGKIDESAISFITDVCNGYAHVLSNEELGGLNYIFDEEQFCFYTAAEVLNRRTGKWVNYLDPNTHEGMTSSLFLTQFGMTVLNDKVSSIQHMFQLAKELGLKKATLL